MKRIYHKAKNFHWAEEWDIIQHLQMNPVERQDVSKELRVKVYGQNTIDVRESHGRK